MGIGVIIQSWNVVYIVSEGMIIHFDLTLCVRRMQGFWGTYYCYFLCYKAIHIIFFTMNAQYN